MTYIKNNRTKTILIFALAITVFVATLAIVFSSKESTITIHFGEQTIYCQTADSSPENILLNEGIKPEDYDYIDLSDFVAGQDSVINVIETNYVSVFDDGIENTYEGSGTVADLFKENDITIGDGDSCDAELDAKLFPGMIITIERFPCVTLICDGTSSRIPLTSGTVADVLTAAKVVLDADDYTEPAVNGDIKAGITINVYRVDYRERTEVGVLEFETTTRNSANLTVGQKEIVQKGINGKQETVYNDKFVNNELKSSEIISQSVLEESVKEIVRIGVKAAEVKSSDETDAKKKSLLNGVISAGKTFNTISELKVPSSIEFDENGIPKNYVKCISGTAKAYTGDSTTATGITPRPGYIAVDPKQIPYGTAMWIVSSNGKTVYGYAIAADTGGFVKKQSCTIDLFMNSESECYDWGHRDVNIYILDV